MKSDIKRGDGRLEISRYFDAPRERVFAWWSSGEKLARWSKCTEASDCRMDMDFRVNGGFTHWMRIATPQVECEFTITGRHEEIAAPERIVYRANFGNAGTKVTVGSGRSGQARA